VLNAKKNKTTDMADKSSSGSGLGFGSVLLLIFITLKLTNVIDWSWWWVMAPLWIPLTLLAIVLIIIGLIKTL
jgi:hypothetical protein